jgi:ATP-dependent protease ClpP protease subunit
MKKIQLNGVIVDNWFDDPWFASDIDKGLMTPSGRVVRALSEADPESGVDLAINSPGGIVDAAREISVALADLAARGVPIRITIGALAASAAAEIVLQAPTGAEVLAHVNSRLMFHSATVAAEGGPDAHRAATADLESVNEPTIEALVAHGLPRTRVEAAFRDDGQLWLTARAAEEYGIVDTILGTEAAAPAVADPDAAARIAQPTAQLERLAERIPTLSRISRLAALGVGEPDPATILDAAPAGEPDAPAADPTPAPDQPEAPAPDSAPTSPAPAPEDPPAEGGASSPSEPPAATPAPTPEPEAPPAPDATVEALRASLEKAELSARNIQSASGKKIAALERDLAAALAERDAARAELEATRQSISDLTARADALAGLVETERTKRASLVGGALAPEGTVDTSVPPASATPCSDALDAIRSLDDRRAYAKAHAAEIAAERAAAARPRRRR